MKKILSLVFASVLLVGFSQFSYAQKKRSSPAATFSGTVGGAAVEVKYHQPSADGREVMGGLVPYGEVWRTGANAATTITFDKDVSIEGESLPQGTYSLYTIPGSDEWTIIFNKATGQWGTQYPGDEDALRVQVPAGSTDSFVETFTISEDGDHLVLAWENTAVKFAVKG